MELKDANAFVTPSGDVYKLTDTGYLFGTLDDAGKSEIEAWGEPQQMGRVMKGWPVLTGWDPDDPASFVWHGVDLKLEQREEGWYVLPPDREKGA
jgi:hypothetical protein